MQITCLLFYCWLEKFKSSWSWTTNVHLFDCVSWQLSSWLIPAVKTVNISSLSPPSLPGLQGLTDLLPQLGSPVLLSLPSQQMMELLSQPGLHRYPPAQVAIFLFKLFDQKCWHFLFYLYKDIRLQNVFLGLFDSIFFFFRHFKCYPNSPRKPLWVNLKLELQSLIQTAVVSPVVSLSSPQLSVETLCRLKSLHSGVSPALIRDLQWPEVTEQLHCQCWTMLLTGLNPGCRAALYDTVLEVMAVVFHHLFVCIKV